MYGQQVSTKCQIISIKSGLYDEVNKSENLLEKYDSFVYFDVLLTVHIGYFCRKNSTS
jgi:hypothetical protein